MGSEPHAKDASDDGDVEAAWKEAQVDAALEPYRDALGEADLAWMRACLLAALSDDPASRELVRAALPRDVDQSGDVFVRPGTKPRRG